jgi:hypothetical protein
MLNRTTITIKLVLEDGSPLAANPLITVYDREDCHVSSLFRDGTVGLDVRIKFGLHDAERSSQGPGCLLWKVTLPGY